jgi:Mor family transcriptional regulator
MSDNTQALEELKDIVGDESYDAIMCRFSGETIYVPRNAHLKTRNAEIRQEYDQLLSSKISSTRAIKMLCRRYRLSIRSIRRIVQ